MIAKTLRARRPVPMVRSTLRPASGGIVARIGPRGIVGIGAASQPRAARPAGLVRPKLVRRVRRYGPLRFLRRGVGMTSPSTLNGMGSWLSKAFSSATGMKLSDVTKGALANVTGIIPGLNIPTQAPAGPAAQSTNIPTASFASGPSTVLVTDAGELPKWVMPTVIGSAVLGGVGLLVALVKK